MLAPWVFEIKPDKVNARHGELYGPVILFSLGVVVPVREPKVVI